MSLEGLRLTLHFDPPIPAGIVGDVRETISYAWERIRSHEMAADGGSATIELVDESDAPEAERRVRAIVSAMSKRQPAVERSVVYEHRLPARYTGAIDGELAASGAVAMQQPGLATLAGAAFEVIEALDRRFLAMATDVFGAKAHHYPSMIAKASLDRIRYFESLAYHATFAFSLREDMPSILNVSNDVIPIDSPPFLELLRQPAQILTPALCYNTYVYFQDRPLDEPTAITARGRCFRYESRNMATLERLWEFDMREIVFLGPKEWVEERRQMAVRATARLVEELELDAWVETANDPFFMNNFAARRFFQLASQTKYELRLSLPYADGRSLAAASFNLHLDYLGKSFGIARDDGFAYTGCVGFGFERWVWALFAQLGPRVEGWPKSVRAALGLA